MTMTEQVARGIAEGLGDSFDDAFASKGEWIRQRGEKGGRFRDISEPMRPDYLDAARAAILAMREPTPAMVAKVAEMANMQGDVSCARLLADWQAMIDAAIGEW